MEVARLMVAPKSTLRRLKTARAIATRALGKTLPPRAEVHHHDENPDNNKNTNLVICQDHAYHMLLHVRARVVRAGGDPELHAWCSACQDLRLKERFDKYRGVRGHNEGACVSVCKDCKNLQSVARNTSRLIERIARDRAALSKQPLLLRSRDWPQYQRSKTHRKGV